MAALRRAFTDGSCVEYVAGCAYAIETSSSGTYTGRQVFIGKGTNQTAELLAIYHLLNDHKGDFEVHTDSKYAIGCLTVWYENWKKNGFRTAKRTPVLNLDIIQNIKKLMTGRTIIFQHVKGHSGVHLNEIVDKAANAARLTQTTLEISG